MGTDPPQVAALRELGPQICWGAQPLPHFPPLPKELESHCARLSRGGVSDIRCPSHLCLSLPPSSRALVTAAPPALFLTRVPFALTFKGRFKSQYLLRPFWTEPTSEPSEAPREGTQRLNVPGGASFRRPRLTQPPAAGGGHFSPSLEGGREHGKATTSWLGQRGAAAASVQVPGLPGPPRPPLLSLTTSCPTWCFGLSWRLCHLSALAHRLFGAGSPSCRTPASATHGSGACRAESAQRRSLGRGISPLLPPCLA